MKHEPRETSPSWDDLAAFLAVARQGGLSAAARLTGGSAPTLGRRMRALERALGRELFVRRSHGYDLTAAGRRLAGDLETAEAAILRATVPPEGPASPLVKVAAGTWTALALAEAMPRLLGDPPDLRIRLLPGEEALSIPRREASIGLRASRPSEAGLAGRRLRRVAFAPYAAPGAPTRWIGVRARTPSARWVAERHETDVAAETDSPRAALDLALAGVGRLVLPTFVGDGRAGLERTGPEIEDLAHEQWLVTHDADRREPAMRRAIDRIVAALR